MARRENGISQLGMVDYSSEKAGAGGSIPSRPLCFQVLAAISRTGLVPFGSKTKTGHTGIRLTPALTRACLIRDWSLFVDALYFRVSSERQTTENQFEDLLQVAEKDGSGRDWSQIRQALSDCVVEEDRRT